MPPDPTGPDPSQRWFVTLPDGRSYGPLTADQMQAAAQRGQLPPAARIRRGDWAEAISHADFLAGRAGSLEGSANLPPVPGQPSTGPSYTQQFVRNPLGTYFFGPRLADYRGDGGETTRVWRRRHFRWWLVLLGLMVASAVLLPLLGGVARGNLELGLGGILLGGTTLLFCGLFFLLGMLMYAGALFEWSWFFRSRTLRHARGMFGDSGARTFYLGFGGLLMGGAALFSLGASLLIGGSLLVNGGRPAPRVQAGPEGAVRQLEGLVRDDRQRLQEVAEPLRQRLDEWKQIGARIQQHPHDLSLREEQLKVERGLPRQISGYRTFASQWEVRVQQLDRLVQEIGGHSDVLQANRRLPDQWDFAAEIRTLEGDRFPLQEVRRMEGRLRAADQMLDQKLSAPGEIASGSLDRLIQDQKAIREQLAQVQRQWGYRSPALDQPPADERLRQAVAQGRIVLADRPPRRQPAAGIPPPPGPPDPLAPPATTGPAATPGPERPHRAGPRSPVPPRPVPSGPAGPPALPLLPGLQPGRDTLRGTARLENSPEGPALVTESLQEHVLVRVPPALLPERYELSADVTRLEGNGGFFFVLRIQGRQAALVIDGGELQDHRTGLVALDRQVLSSPGYPDPLLAGTQLPQDKPVHLVCTVDGNRIALAVDGTEKYRWEGDVGRLSLPPFYRSESPQLPHLGSFHSRYRVQNITLRRFVSQR